jgi:thiol-disulfide isomerase/thioredoxin
MTSRAGNLVRWAMTLAVLLSFAMAGESRAAGNPKVGEPAPPFSGTTLDGDEISLEAMRGNVIIVNFWATWCAPCRVELPLLHAYAKLREANGLRVVAVTLDRATVSVRGLRRLQDGLALPLLRRFEGDYSTIGRAVPTNYVIDRAGIIRYAKADAFTLDELNELLVPLLNEPPPSAPPGGAAASASEPPATVDQEAEQTPP